MYSSPLLSKNYPGKVSSLHSSCIKGSCIFPQMHYTYTPVVLSAPQTRGEVLVPSTALPGCNLTTWQQAQSGPDLTTMLGNLVVGEEGSTNCHLPH